MQEFECETEIPRKVHLELPRLVPSAGPQFSPVDPTTSFRDRPSGITNPSCPGTPVAIFTYMWGDRRGIWTSPAFQLDRESQDE